MWKTRKEFTCKKNRHGIIKVMHQKSHLIEALQATECHSKVNIFPFYWYFSHFKKWWKNVIIKFKYKKLFGWEYLLAAAKSTCRSELEFICGQWRYFHYLLKATSASLFIIWISLNILCECENCTWIPVQRYHQLPTMMGYQQHNSLSWLHYFVFQPQPLRQFRQVFDV